jgi:hypothetical protein
MVLVDLGFWPDRSYRDRSSQRCEAMRSSPVALVTLPNACSVSSSKHFSFDAAPPIHDERGTMVSLAGYSEFRNATTAQSKSARRKPGRPRPATCSRPEWFRIPLPAVQRLSSRCTVAAACESQE